MLRKKIIFLVAFFTMLIGVAACSAPKQTCRESGCNETSIYEDGYCKYHYYLNSGEEILKDIVN